LRKDSQPEFLDDGNADFELIRRGIANTPVASLPLEELIPIVNGELSAAGVTVKRIGTAARDSLPNASIPPVSSPDFPADFVKKALISGDADEVPNGSKCESDNEYLEQDVHRSPLYLKLDGKN
jgi:hypothetical protein